MPTEDTPVNDDRAGSEARAAVEASLSSFEERLTALRATGEATELVEKLQELLVDLRTALRRPD